LYFNLSKEKGSLSPLSFRYKKIGEKERERERGETAGEMRAALVLPPPLLLRRK
jgi:hypothetical protein